MISSPDINKVAMNLYDIIDQICVQPVSSCLQTVTGKRAPIHGKGELQLRIGPLNLQHPMWVADIQDKCILGLHFLEHHDC